MAFLKFEVQPIAYTPGFIAAEIKHAGSDDWIYTFIPEEIWENQSELPLFVGKIWEEVDNAES